MAKKEKEAKKTLERVYIIPLRKEYQKAPKWKRTKKAVNALHNFIVKHMKSDNVKIGRHLNLELWKHGIKNPPHHVKVNTVKYEDGKVIVELFGKPIEEPKKPEEKKEKPKVAKKEEKIEVKKEEKVEEAEKLEEKLEEIKEEKQEKAKEIEKEEIKELKKELPKHAPKEAKEPKDLHLRKKEMIPGR